MGDCAEDFVPSESEWVYGEGIQEWTDSEVPHIDPEVEIIMFSWNASVGLPS